MYKYIAIIPIFLMRADWEIIYTVYLGKHAIDIDIEPSKHVTEPTALSNYIEKKRLKKLLAL